MKRLELGKDICWVCKEKVYRFYPKIKGQKLCYKCYQIKSIESTLNQICIEPDCLKKKKPHCKYLCSMHLDRKYRTPKLIIWKRKYARFYSAIRSRNDPEFRERRREISNRFNSTPERKLWAKKYYRKNYVKIRARERTLAYVLKKKEYDSRPENKLKKLETNKRYDERIRLKKLGLPIPKELELKIDRKRKIAKVGVLPPTLKQN